MFRSWASRQNTERPRKLQIRRTQPQSRIFKHTRQNRIDKYRDAAPVEAEPEKTEAQIQEEIQAIFRQITASVTFLPVLDGNCTFNVLVYADADSDVPIEWGDSDAKEIKNGEKVQLRSFSTSNHKVDTMVSYRLADWWIHATTAWRSEAFRGSQHNRDLWLDGCQRYLLLLRG